MAETSISVCPHCGKPSKLIPLKAHPGATTAPQEKTNIFQAAQDTFFDTNEYSDPEQQHIVKRNFWASDGATFAIAGAYSGTALLLLAWWQQWNIGAVVAGGALAVGIGLHVLKIVLHRPARTAAAEPQNKRAPIKVETVSTDGKHWLLEQLDASIKYSELQAVAGAVVDSGNWTRATTTKHVSQGKHQKLQTDFVRLHFLEPLPNQANGYRVTGTGRRFLRQVAAS